MRELTEARELTEGQLWRLANWKDDTAKVVGWWARGPLVRWEDGTVSVVRPNGKLTRLGPNQLEDAFGDVEALPDERRG